MSKTPVKSALERLAIEALHDDSTFETGVANPQRSLEIALMKRVEARAENLGEESVELNEAEEN